MINSHIKWVPSNTENMFIREKACWRWREINRAKPLRQDTMGCGLKFAGKEGPDLIAKGHLCVGEIIA